MDDAMITLHTSTS